MTLRANGVGRVVLAVRNQRLDLSTDQVVEVEPFATDFTVEWEKLMLLITVRLRLDLDAFSESVGDFDAVTGDTSLALTGGEIGCTVLSRGGHASVVEDDEITGTGGAGLGVQVVEAILD